MAITTPDAVPGELITAAWGDAVRADLTSLDTTRVVKAGDTMSGALQIGGHPASAVGVLLDPVGTVSANFGGAVGAPSVFLVRAGTAVATGGVYAAFRTPTTLIGSIAVATASSVVYNTTSDPRVKTPPPQTRGIGDAAARAAALGRTAWRGQHLDPDTGAPDAQTWDLLSSHDVEDVAPYAVTGERDAVDDAGHPVYQQVNYPGLVPLLFAALADALDRIAALEAA